MPMLAVNGIDVPVLADSLRIGDIMPDAGGRTAVDGTPIEGRLWAPRRTITFRTPPMTAHDARAFRNLFCGKGFVARLASGQASANALAPSTFTAAVRSHLAADGSWASGEGRVLRDVLTYTQTQSFDAACTNLLTSNQATGTDTLGTTTGFLAQVGAAISNDPTREWQGASSLKVICSASANSGMQASGAISVPVNGTYAFSGWVRGDAQAFTARLRATSGTSGNWATTSITAHPDYWQRFVAIGTISDATSRGSTVFELIHPTASACTVWVDGLMFEQLTTTPNVASA